MINFFRALGTWTICVVTAVFAPQVSGNSDLKLTLTASPTAAYPGTEIHFQGDLYNYGPDASVDVHLECLLPYRFSPLGVSFPSGVSTIDDQHVSCTIPLLAPHTTVTVSMQAMLTGNGRGSETVVMTAKGSATDPVSDNNVSTQTITIMWPNEADVGVSGGARDYTVTMSDKIILDLSTSCYGPDGAWDVHSSLFMPAQIEVSYATTSSNSEVTTSTGLVSFITPLLDAGQSAKHTVVAIPRATGTFYIEWEIFRSGGGDWTFINNFVSISITVNPSGPNQANSLWQLYP